MAQHGEAADHVGKLVKVHTVVLVGVQALEDAVHRRLVIGFLQKKNVVRPESSISFDVVHFLPGAFTDHDVEPRTAERSKVTHPEQITKFILQQLFQLSLGQGVLVPLLAGVFIKDANEEGHSLLDVRHDDCWLKGTERVNRSV